MKNYDNFFNTTKLSGKDMVHERFNASRQEDKILRYFKDNQGAFSPAHLWEVLFKNDGVPITSVRRAITGLTSKGLLVKTDKKVTGEYGKANYCWKLAGVADVQQPKLIDYGSVPVRAW